MKLRQISLVHGEHKYIFRYEAGQEKELINCLAEMAGDTERDFDWFDASVLSYKLGCELETDLREV